MESLQEGENARLRTAGDHGVGEWEKRTELGLSQATTLLARSERFQELRPFEAGQAL